LANHYITDAGAGAVNGTDWSNAWNDLPTTFVRGDTYYLADGTYSSRTLNTAVSGALYITFKKATDADHGTDTGWIGTAHDGTASWSSQWYFQTGYWKIDGSYRNDWDNGHGFKIQVPRAGSSPAVKFAANCAHVELLYIDINCTDNTSIAGGQDCIYAVDGGCNYFKLQYCYVHECARIHLYLRASDDCILEYNQFTRNNYSASDHGEPIASGYGTDRLIIRFNKFIDIPGASAIICTPDSASSVYMNADWEIYGNIFSTFDSAWGIIGIINWQSTQNFKIYNNTVYNQIGGSRGGVNFLIEHSGVTHSNNWVYNNLWYNTYTAEHIFNDAGSGADYNWYYLATHTAETHQQAGLSDPFVDKANDNYHLTGNTNPGTNLGAGYQTDMDGRTRSNWDRGAFEYYVGGGGGVGILVQSAAGSSNKRHK
jgi:hypothetical protein